MIIVLDAARADIDLMAGALTCPRCAASLRPWSWAPVRHVRQRDGSTRLVRPRRARCTGCQATQVLLPASCLPRRADATEVIGAALLAHAHGQGHRTIARDLDRPPPPCVAGCVQRAAITSNGSGATVSSGRFSWTKTCSPRWARRPRRWATLCARWPPQSWPGDAGSPDTPRRGHSSALLPPAGCSPHRDQHGISGDRCVRGRSSASTAIAGSVSMSPSP